MIQILSSPFLKSGLKTLLKSSMFALAVLRLWWNWQTRYFEVAFSPNS